jgi:hypothetical protein
MTRTYYGAPVPRSTGPHPDPLEACPTCNGHGLIGGFEHNSGAPCYHVEPCPDCGVEQLDPDRLREDRDERRRMERENPYAE